MIDVSCANEGSEEKDRGVEDYVFETFREFTKSEDKLSDWLSWQALIEPGVMLNKDGGLMATFVYESLVEGQADKAVSKAIEGVCQLIGSFGSGWSLYSEKRKEKGDEEIQGEGVRVKRDGWKDAYYLTLFWLPKEDKGVLKNVPSVVALLGDGEVRKEGYLKEDSEEVFRWVMKQAEKELGVLCYLRQLEGQEYLNYLRSTIVFDGSVMEMPEVPVFLDALLSLDVTIRDQESENGDIDTVVARKDIFTGVDIGEETRRYLKIVSPLGYLGDRANELVERLDDCEFEYRFVFRFVFFGDEEAKKERARYTSSWCDGRKSMLGLLYDEKKEYSQEGYYSACVLIVDKDKELIEERVEKVEEVIIGMEIPAIVEEYNLKDVWYSTVPGMVRANLNPPLAMLRDVSELVLMPKG